MPKTNTTDKAICLIYTLAWQLYSYQGALGLEKFGPILLVGLVVFSLYKTIYVLITYRLTNFFKGLTLLLILLSIYGLIHLFWGPQRYLSALGFAAKIPQHEYLKNIYISIPTIYVYYDYAMKKVLTEKLVTLLAYVFLVFAIIGFFNYYTTSRKYRGGYIDGLTNNFGYKFVPLIILACFITRWKYIYILICFAFVMLSIKRGAIVVSLVNIIGVIYIYYKKSNRERNQFVAAIGIVIFLAVAGYGSYKFYNSSSGFKHRLESTQDGDSSGRDVLSDRIINNFVKEDFSLKLLGNGADATATIAGNYAHNDWLEVLTNQGVLGIIMLGLFYLYWYKDVRIFKSAVNPDHYVPFIMMFVDSLLMSIFSMSYTSYGPPAGIIIGICYQSLYNQRTIRNRK